MVTWEQRKLGDIAKRVIRKNKENDILPVLTNSADLGIVLQNDYFDKAIAKNLNNYYIVSHNDFVYNPRISKKAPFGPINRNKLNIQGVMSPLYLVFRFNSEMDLNFLEYYFQSSKWHPFMYKNGDSGARADRFAIKNSVLMNMTINVPTLDQQKRIGKILLLLENSIALQQRKLEQLELLQKSILQTIFTSNNKKEKIELNKLANYRRGSFPQPYTNKKWYGGKNSKPFVQVIDVNDNLKLHEQTKERISEIAQPKSVFVPKGSIIVTLQGSIGRVAITQYDSYVDRTLLILTDFKKKIDKYYFANALKMVFNKEKLKAPGGTIKTITKSTLSSFKIVLPNIKLQIQYGKLLKSVDKQIILNKNRIMKLKKIKQFLLQNIFI
ncbi:restriction endonuclease subunit S [Lactobacillus amylovorus]|uniref:restriction endonuclease subunit S n=1 Tax=Lactobacillus amylovorus TaxID=1604 RepID=UPI0024A9AFC2|nr:restriction endonuclease subunit S [Lactobacillus amylovorus]